MRPNAGPVFSRFTVMALSTITCDSDYPPAIPVQHGRPDGATECPRCCGIRTVRPLIGQNLSVVFYGLTTIRSEGLVTVPQDVRQFGMAKESLIARQFMLGVVQTAEGLPIYHEVFDGNTAETKTLLPTLGKVLERFPTVRRLVLIADPSGMRGSKR